MARTYGITSGRVAILDDNEQVDPKGFGDYTQGVTDGIFTIDQTTAMGITAGNITGLAPTMTKVYGSDMVVEVSGKGTGSVSVTVGTNDLPSQILYALAGFSVDENGIASLNSETRPPYAALELNSHGSKNQLLHFALVKGTFSPEEHNLATNNESVQEVADSLTFTALNRQTDKIVYAESDENDDKFDADAWTKFVFPVGGSTTTTTVAPETTTTTSK